MKAQNWDKQDVQFLANLALPVRKLAAAMKQGKGARIGQSTVVSQKVHTFNPLTPQFIHILQDVDAGQTFYQQTAAGRVYHMDIFHQQGLIDHHLVAAALKRAADVYQFQFSLSSIVFAENGSRGVNTDYIDIQTGTGGGRVTGALTYGKKLSLRKAHENHVHFAAMFEAQHQAFLFYAVLAIEAVILSNHLELRRNERLIHIKGKQEKPEMADYTDETDSFMQRNSSGFGQKLSPAVKQHKLVQDALELADHFDTIQDAQQFMNKLHSPNKSKFMQDLEDDGERQRLLDRLTGMGIVKAGQRSLELTVYGQELEQYLKEHFLEIEAHLRKSFRAIKPLSRQAGKNKIQCCRYEWNTGVAAWQKNNDQKDGELAVADTVALAARRMVIDQQPEFQINDEDISYFAREKVSKAELCVLIDTSASMTGARWRAAKFLVRYLLLSTPDRVGVITFQENYANITVPLTRDYREVENCLRTIKPAGATPLALGIKTCLDYLTNTRTHNPLLLLISDGLPTLADQSRDPVADALAAARAIKQQGYGFTCIGLKPHHSYLTQLAELAGGSAYMLEELEKQLLVQAAWEQRLKLV
ncbi:VWA domain-containing protein|uniref:Magnesium chelatase subunit D n=1 Tax=Dendrosporobacter quercicolus TaxID=146817 RepID=A0A1G9KR45_9FIRM|nr:VWA domain-containing protein [Dendrosporobacter quercicolus]NSL46479.1 VWA domain-containing protein [Dendrosporobacter quercicolus DSM 1736]SDL52122.1 magnesium chelatase subunit D [Dendrosporobacter quercicolus]